MTVTRGRGEEEEERKKRKKKEEGGGGLLERVVDMQASADMQAAGLLVATDGEKSQWWLSSQGVASKPQHRIKRKKKYYAY